MPDPAGDHVAVRVELLRDVLRQRGQLQWDVAVRLEAEPGRRHHTSVVYRVTEATHVDHALAGRDRLQPGHTSVVERID